MNNIHFGRRPLAYAGKLFLAGPKPGPPGAGAEDRSQEPGDRSQEPGDRSLELGDRSQEPGDRSHEPGDRSQEPGLGQDRATTRSTALKLASAWNR